MFSSKYILRKNIRPSGSEGFIHGLTPMVFSRQWSPTGKPVVPLKYSASPKKFSRLGFARLCEANLKINFATAKQGRTDSSEALAKEDDNLLSVIMFWNPKKLQVRVFSF